MRSPRWLTIAPAVIQSLSTGNASASARRSAAWLPAGANPSRKRVLSRERKRARGGQIELRAAHRKRYERATRWPPTMISPRGGLSSTTSLG